MTIQKDHSPTIVLHDGSDVVRLTIGEERVAVDASRTVLIIMSPVFKSMLTGGYREDAASEVPLPGDDPDALLVVLRIAHLKFKDLPATLTFQELYHLAIACDKYDTVGLVRPFWSRYGEPHLSLVGEAGHEEWLFIAWTFGMEDECEQVMSRLILETKVVKRALVCAGREEFGKILPPYAEEYILETRLNVIAGFITITDDQFDLLCKRTVDSDSDADIGCRRYKLGRMLEYLTQYLSFLPKATTARALEKVALADLCEYLTVSVSEACGEKDMGGTQCGRAACKDECQTFKTAIYTLVSSSLKLPEQLLTHIRIQTRK